jgi:hypothetical protein
MKSRSPRRPRLLGLAGCRGAARGARKRGGAGAHAPAPCPGAARGAARPFSSKGRSGSGSRRSPPDDAHWRSRQCYCRNRPFSSKCHNRPFSSKWRRVSEIPASRRWMPRACGATHAPRFRTALAERLDDGALNVQRSAFVCMVLYLPHGVFAWCCTLRLRTLSILFPLSVASHRAYHSAYSAMDIHVLHILQ